MAQSLFSALRVSWASAFSEGKYSAVYSPLPRHAGRCMASSACLLGTRGLDGLEWLLQSESRGYSVKMSALP